MNGNFEQCLEWLLEHEGGFVNDSRDSGGMTNKGITLNTYSRWLSEVMDVDAELGEEAMRNIPDAHVEQIYRQEYWNKVNGDQLPSGVDWAVFDWGVNSGTGRAARMLQKCVGVTADGAIGPMTLSAVRDYGDTKLIEELAERRQAFYERLKTFETFGAGWTRRNEETKEQALSLAKS